MKLVLIRHAHRDTSDRERDNGLSAKGLSQVADLLRAPNIKSILNESANLAFFSSPKKRCIETIEPLATYNQIKLQIHESLDEQHHEESQRDFLKRIEIFFEDLEKSKHNSIFVCSHGDWIPAFTALFNIEGLAFGAQIDLQKSKYLILERKSQTQWRIVNS